MTDAGAVSSKKVVAETRLRDRQAKERNSWDAPFVSMTSPFETMGVSVATTACQQVYGFSGEKTLL